MLQNSALFAIYARHDFPAGAVAAGLRAGGVRGGHARLLHAGRRRAAERRRAPPGLPLVRRAPRAVVHYRAPFNGALYIMTYYIMVYHLMAHR